MKTSSFMILMAFLFIGYGCNQTSIPIVKTDVILMSIKSTNCQTVEGFLNYENDTIRVAYIFWAEKGIMGLFIHNKLMKPLYIDWKKCSYITGTTKHDYWDETITVTNTGSSISNSESYSQNNISISGSTNTQLSSNSRTEYWNNFYNPAVYSETETKGDATSSTNIKATNLISSQYLNSTFNYSLTRIAKPERITFVPPGTTVSIALYTIFGKNILDISLNKFLSKDTTVLMEISTQVVRNINNVFVLVDTLEYIPKKVSLPFIEYDPQKSPLSFRSFVTYSTDEKFSTEAYVNSNFYIDRITQMPISIFKAKIKGIPINDNTYNIWSTPHSFFIFRSVELK